MELIHCPACDGVLAVVYEAPIVVAVCPSCGREWKVDEHGPSLNTPRHAVPAETSSGASLLCEDPPEHKPDASARIDPLLPDLWSRWGGRLFSNEGEQRARIIHLVTVLVIVLCLVIGLAIAIPKWVDGNPDEAVLAVVTSFFVGLGLGFWAFIGTGLLLAPRDNTTVEEVLSSHRKSESKRQPGATESPPPPTEDSDQVAKPANGITTKPKEDPSSIQDREADVGLS